MLDRKVVRTVVTAWSFLYNCAAILPCLTISHSISDGLERFVDADWADDVLFFPLKTHENFHHNFFRFVHLYRLPIYLNPSPPTPSLQSKSKAVTSHHFRLRFRFRVLYLLNPSLPDKGKSKK